MRQKIVHGTTIDVTTPSEVAGIIGEAAHRIIQAQRMVVVRASAIIQLDSNGNGVEDVYHVPAGMRFALRRLNFDLNTAADPVTGAVQLNTAGVWIKLLRSGAPLEYAMPLAPTAYSQVPGIQTWTEEEGPFVTNGETFQVQANGLTASAVLEISIQGLLHPNPGNQ